MDEVLSCEPEDEPTKLTSSDSQPVFTQTLSIKNSCAKNYNNESYQRKSKDSWFTIFGGRKNHP